ncbi:MAG: 16S rRNA (cytidine(1402)-2'-O)-methyltransferase [Deltaproteobacteria bacterium]|nr:16S rRNA (cytidine(1402)-2'-O)-methyltransferase [Deltaproteobacteria bacterium]
MARAKRSDRSLETSMSPHSGGVLYVVATPIGNLGDLTPRARLALHSVSLIAAEDTRRLRSLGGTGGFRARLLSMPAPREAERIATVVDHLAAGRDAAVVTDAGTPVVSDPGSRIVRAARDAGFRVVPIPGASAVATALAGAGLGGAGFLFLGFLPPHGAQRRNALTEVARSPRTVVLFEAPHRLGRTLADLQSACGGGRHAVIARELTKIHEEIQAGPLQHLIDHLPERIRGEITLLLEGAEPGARAPTQDTALVVDSLAGIIEELLSRGMSPSQAAKEAARRLGCDRRDAYRAAVAAQSRHAPDESDR